MLVALQHSTNVFNIRQYHPLGMLDRGRASVLLTKNAINTFITNVLATCFNGKNFPYGTEHIGNTSVIEPKK